MADLRPNANTLIDEWGGEADMANWNDDDTSTVNDILRVSRGYIELYEENAALRLKQAQALCDLIMCACDYSASENLDRGDIRRALTELGYDAQEGEFGHYHPVKIEEKQNV